MMKKITELAGCLCLILSMLVLAGCGGSSSGGSDSDESDVQSSALLGPKMQGIYFETQSLSGLTDEDGGYRYREGEVINFRLGDIPLGSTLAKSDLSPFDWLGIDAPIEESALVNRLENPMLNSLDLVLNAASLLFSLDVDGNLENGIDLGDAHQRLTGLELDMAVKAKVFNESSATKELVNDLVSRTPLSLLTVADHLYKTLDLSLISQRVSASNLTLSDEVQESVSVTYDQSGNLETETLVLDEQTNAIELAYQYDAENRLTRLSNSYTNQTESMVYEDDRLAFRFVETAGSPSKSREIFKYDESGLLSQLNQDLDGDGKTDIVTDIEYANNSETVITRDTSDGVTKESQNERYFKDGLVEKSIEDYDNDGVPELEMIYQYDDQSRMRVRQTISNDPSIQSDTSYFDYDDQDRLIRYSVDKNDDEVIDYIESYNYDYNNNRTAFRRDMNADGQWDYIALYRFDSNGNRIELTEDTDGNGIVDVHWRAELQETTIESDWNAVISEG